MYQRTTPVTWSQTKILRNLEHARPETILKMYFPKLFLPTIYAIRKAYINL